jgi:phosphoadenosine phosphosulfate reductase
MFDLNNPEGASAQDILEWAARTYGTNLAVAVSFGGPSGYVLLDMLAQIDRNVHFYYLDTGLLFAETHEHIARVEAHYGIVATPVRPALTVTGQAAHYGSSLWENDPDLCCKLRKIEPQREFLRSYTAWVSGLRRDQTPSRAGAKIVSWDEKFGLTKINPLATWTEDMVWAYIAAHNVPYNELHDRGYRSIGCGTCTVATRLGDPARSGRWKEFAKTECGLHA